MISTSQIFQSPSTQDPSSTFQITASYPGFGNILHVTITAGVIVAGQIVSGPQVPYGAIFLPYGTQGTTGVGGTGTYALSVFGGNINSEIMNVTLSPVGQAGNGSLWYQTDTTFLFNRNTANNGWNFIGPININFLGLLPRAGGSVTEPITGSTGLMTKDGNIPFSGVPYVNSKNSLAATLADLAEVQTNLEEQISVGVSKSINAIGLPSLNSNMLIVFGTLGVDVGTPGNPTITTLIIPISGLTYGDGTPVKQTECHGFASINGAALSFSYIFLIPQDPFGMSWQCYGTTNIANDYFNGTINYYIIAVKTGS